MRVLVGDDQPDILRGLRLLFRAEGIEGVFASSPAGVLTAVQDEELDVALLDLNYTRDTTSGVEGLDLLARVRRQQPDLPVVVMTAWASVPTAVEAMRRGARDYVEKPWNNDDLLARLRRHAESAAAGRSARAAAADHPDLPPLFASSPAMAPVMRVMDRVAPSDASVLVTGEHGAGKDVIARWIHARSHRSAGPFVPVNVGALAAGVFESELFGHVRGAFTGAVAERAGCFELAHGGTLFLDEIGTLSLDHQAKLLRVLQSGELTAVGSNKTKQVDVRIVSATNATLTDEVAAGRFREDLLYRLNTVEIALPPLRNRPEDIVPLGRYFLERLARRYGRTDLTFSEGALAKLRAHGWPGNIRELAHAIERGVLMAPEGSIEPDDLALSGTPTAGRALDTMTLEEAERYLVERALLRAGGNAGDAARALGLSRSAFYRRLQGIRGGSA
ncbi:MAG TPA: sigma-54 dependent transcriptional regulator [Polyangiaceae bacterium]|nr:sigma-54 dependent transcriptional regulator [Polyangiaceae bacterium]